MSLLSTLFGPTSQQSERIEILSPSEYKTAISNPKTQLVDVRTRPEYCDGHIEGALNIDLFQNSIFIEEFEKMDKDRPVYIYCRSGGRSLRAAAKLVDMGFTKIYDLQGGYLSWRLNNL